MNAYGVRNWRTSQYVVYVIATNRRVSIHDDYGEAIRAANRLERRRRARQKGA